MDKVILDKAHLFNSRIKKLLAEKISAKGANLSKTVIQRLIVKEKADFTEAVLNECKIISGEVKELVLNDAKAQLTRFQGLTIEKLEAVGSDVRHMLMKNIKAKYCDFSRSVMDEVQIANSKFESSKFVNAEMKFAKLLKASLKKANFDGAIIDGLNFEDIDLGGAILEGVKFKLPPKFRSVLIDSKTKLDHELKELYKKQNRGFLKFITDESINFGVFLRDKTFSIIFELTPYILAGIAIGVTVAITAASPIGVVLSLGATIGCGIAIAKNGGIDKKLLSLKNVGIVVASTVFTQGVTTILPFVAATSTLVVAGASIGLVTGSVVVGIDKAKDFVNFVNKNLANTMKEKISFFTQSKDEFVEQIKQNLKTYAKDRIECFRKYNAFKTFLSDEEIPKNIVDKVKPQAVKLELNEKSFNRKSGVSEKNLKTKVGKESVSSDSASFVEGVLEEAKREAVKETNSAVRKNIQRKDGRDTKVDTTQKSRNDLEPKKKKSEGFADSVSRRSESEGGVSRGRSSEE